MTKVIVFRKCHCAKMSKKTRNIQDQVQFATKFEKKSFIGPKIIHLEKKIQKSECIRMTLKQLANNF